MSNADVMVHFGCSRCDRPLVWAAASVTVQCPSCGRWIRANRFWREREIRPKPKKAAVRPEQMELF